MITASVSLRQFNDFVFRDLEKFSGYTKLTASHSFNKRYKIIDKKYKHVNIILTFETEEAKTWFLLSI